MPKVRRGTKPPPEGWELIEPTLTELAQKMRQAESEPTEAKRKVETAWPIMRLHHQRTRYIYDIYYRRKAITRDLYDYCIKQGHADAALIAKWKKMHTTQGYQFGTTCICRVPKQQLDENKVIECVHCGCRGCASGS
ncbi:Component of the SF3b subcomplex of the U2 snRNP [Batrachochytrium dendrobatidis]